MSPVGKQWHGPTLDGKPIVLFKHRDSARSYNRSRHVKGGVIDLNDLPYQLQAKTGISDLDRWAVFV